MFHRAADSCLYQCPIVMHDIYLVALQPLCGVSQTVGFDCRRDCGQNLCVTTPILAAMTWLPTNDAIVLALLSAASGLPLLIVRQAPRWLTAVGAIMRELALVLSLYAIWGFAGQLAATQPIGAVRRGQWIWDFQRTLWLPNERTLQNWILDLPNVVKSLNLYYAFAHVPSLFIFLVWLFFRHRDRYPQWRNTLAFLTLSCLLVQLIPVAPPRLVPALQMIDTGKLYNQTVYPPLGQGGPDQFSAMPSLHIGWAALFTFAAIAVSRSRWRWFTIAHLVMTFTAVTLTANHYWLDGIVAIMLIGTSVLLARGVRWLNGTVRSHA